MDYPLFLAKRVELKIKVVFGIIRPNSLNIYSTLILNHCDKLNKSITNLKFVFHRKTQVTRVESSIKVIKHVAAEILGTLVGRHALI